MPISISLPAPSIKWVSQFMSPLAGNTSNENIGLPIGGSVVGIFSGVGMRGPQARGGWLNSTNGTARQGYEPYGSNAVSSALLYKNHLGRLSARTANTGNGFAGNFWMPGQWLPDLRGSAAVAQPGSYVDPESVVGVFDVDFAVDAVLSPVPPVGWATDVAGFYFCPWQNLMDARHNLPTGIIPSGGFGVFFNDVGGVATLEYTSWDNTGATLERVPIVAPILTDLTIWNSVRFVIISATPGRGATLTVEANGQPVIPVRTFGDPELVEPAGVDGIPNSAGLAMGCGWIGLLVGKPQLFTTFSAKFGRFTPGGQQLQGE